MSLNPHFLELQSTDNYYLPAMFYEPANKTNSVVIFLHGTASSVFYSPERMNTMGKLFGENDIAFFSFNNRGAQWIRRLTNSDGNKVEFGSSYELIRECEYDIDGAIKFLKEKGYNTFYLAGHSTGANKIAVYNHYKPNNAISGYIILGGGDDTGIYYSCLGDEKFTTLLQESKRKIDNGNGRDLVVDALPFGAPMSYQSLYDILNPDGGYNIFAFHHAYTGLPKQKKEAFLEIKALKKRTLIVYGSEEEYCSGPVEKAIKTLKKVVDSDHCSFATIEGADHGFDGKDTELTNALISWIKNK